MFLWLFQGSKHSTYSSSITSDDEKEILETSHGGAVVKSPFDIAKAITKDPNKSYPKAFNVAKRMEAKKNNVVTLSHSQELSKKVFGQKGKSFSQVFYYQNVLHCLDLRIASVRLITS